jgi:hypothetical protein
MTETEFDQRVLLAILAYVKWDRQTYPEAFDEERDKRAAKVACGLGAFKELKRHQPVGGFKKLSAGGQDNSIVLAAQQPEAKSYRRQFIFDRRVRPRNLLSLCDPDKQVVGATQGYSLGRCLAPLWISTEADPSPPAALPQGERGEEFWLPALAPAPC